MLRVGERESSEAKQRREQRAAEEKNLHVNSPTKTKQSIATKGEQDTHRGGGDNEMAVKKVAEEFHPNWLCHAFKWQSSLAMDRPC